jgi:hypothetical protein
MPLQRKFQHISLESSISNRMLVLVAACCLWFLPGNSLVSSSWSRTRALVPKSSPSYNSIMVSACFRTQLFYFADSNVSFPQELNKWRIFFRVIFAAGTIIQGADGTTKKKKIALNR